jgi:hypothetical protein
VRVGIFSALLRSGGEVVSGVEIDGQSGPAAKMGVNVMEPSFLSTACAPSFVR